MLSAIFSISPIFLFSIFFSVIIIIIFTNSNSINSILSQIKRELYNKTSNLAIRVKFNARGLFCSIFDNTEISFQRSLCDSHTFSNYLVIAPHSILRVETTSAWYTHRATFYNIIPFFFVQHNL